MKAYGGVALQLHAFYNLGTRLGWVIRFTIRPVYPTGKYDMYDDDDDDDDKHISFFKSNLSTLN
jgi:hypothetical protein